VPDDKRKIAAAEDIHDFEQILLRILDGRKVESAREEKREEGKLSPTALFTRLPMPPTTLQIAIFETLNGKSMKKDELAAKTGWETSSVSDALKPMMKVGIIENRRGLGYFRHDAPPLPESQSSIDTKQ
jgi:predicted transcriptional regulator